MNRAVRIVPSRAEYYPSIPFSSLAFLTTISLPYRAKEMIKQFIRYAHSAYISTDKFGGFTPFFR